MRTSTRTILMPAILLALLVVTGCGEEEGVRVYESTRPASYNWPETEARQASYETDIPIAEDENLVWVWDVPEGWVDAPEVADLHVADYRFPGATEALPGRMTLAVFDGEAGGVQANVMRWQRQLYLTEINRLAPAPGDTVSRPMQTRIGPATIVELSGQYQGDYVPRHLLGAIVQVPAQGGGVLQTWTLKLVGDKQTVRNNYAKFVRVLLSLRPEGMPAPDLPDNLLEQTPLGPEPPTPAEPAEPTQPADGSDANDANDANDAGSEQPDAEDPDADNQAKPDNA